MKKILIVYSMAEFTSAKIHQLENFLNSNGYKAFILGSYTSSQDIRMWDLDQLEPGEFGVIKEMVEKVIKS